MPNTETKTGKLKHSPSPWFISKDGEDYMIETTSGARAIATIEGSVYEERDEANAKLIAAAPTMLEALQNLITEISPAYNFDLRNAPPVVQQALEVIKQATGE